MKLTRVPSTITHVARFPLLSAIISRPLYGLDMSMMPILEENIWNSESLPTLPINL